jgi:phosphoenolpyruvate carboxylase
MEQLYTNPTYANHLKQRGNEQKLCLNFFSEDKKDGGYLMAN